LLARKSEHALNQRNSPLRGLQSTAKQRQSGGIVGGPPDRQREIADHHGQEIIEVV